MDAEEVVIDAFSFLCFYAVLEFRSKLLPQTIVHHLGDELLTEQSFLQSFHIVTMRQYMTTMKRQLINRIAATGNEFLLQAME